jgi:hypothetical protein
MSLNDEQREGIRRELRRNLELGAVTMGAIAEELGFSVERLVITLDVTEKSDPTDVWMLRDFLEQAARSADAMPEHYGVLTESARADAQRWFGLPIRPEWLQRSSGK